MRVEYKEQYNWNMSIDRSRRITFEEMADIYLETRPGYPEQLIEDVIQLSGIPPVGRILEIGCGSGNATIPFAKRGYEILAVELGPRLANIAKEQCRTYPKVMIINMAFEDCPLEASAFDLAISADAFHWIVPEIGYPKVAKALKPGCSLAFFWNVRCKTDSVLSESIRKVYSDCAPQAEKPDDGFTPEWLVDTITQVINSAGCFGPITVKQYDTNEILTAEKYTRGLWTFSSHRPLMQETRTKLYEGIRKVIDEHGGSIEQKQKVVLFHTFVKKE